MSSISFSTAMAITGLSRRTLWRRIGEGRILRAEPHAMGEETRLNLDDVLPMSFLQVEPEEHDIIVAADRGDAVAQCDLAILLLIADRPAKAIPWFTLSAQQFYPDAMCFLGRGYLAGEGVARDLDAGVMWLKNAAIKGNPLGQALMLFLHSPKGQTLLQGQDPAALGAALDEVERKVLLAALAETADPA